MVVDYATIRYYLTKSGAQLNEVFFHEEDQEMEIFFTLHHVDEMVKQLGMEVMYITIAEDMKIGLKLYKK